MLVSEVVNSNFLVRNVPHKSFSQALNSFDKILMKCEGERKEGKQKRNNFDFACVGDER